MALAKRILKNEKDSQLPPPNVITDKKSGILGQYSIELCTDKHINKIKLRVQKQTGRDGSANKSAYCSCRSPRFGVLSPTQQLTLTSDALFWPPQAVKRMQCTYSHIHIKMCQ